MKKLIFLSLFFVCSNWAYPYSYFKTINGNRYFGDIKEETETHLFVELENEDRIVKIPKDELVLIEDEEFGLEVYKPDYLKPVDPNTAIEPFYAKGNNIYIPINSTKIVQRAGGCTLKMLFVTESPDWTIVDTEKEAHYIMKYVFDDKGADKAYIMVLDRTGKTVYTSAKVSARDFVPWHAGEESADKLYKTLLKNIKNGKI